jgi:hypothetical protein
MNHTGWPGSASTLGRCGRVQAQAIQVVSVAISSSAAKAAAVVASPHLRRRAASLHAALREDWTRYYLHSAKSPRIVACDILSTLPSNRPQSTQR